MNYFSRSIVCLVLWNISFSASGVRAAELNTTNLPFVDHPCTSQETWTWSNHEAEIGNAWVLEFENSLKGKTSQVRSFSEALALRKLTNRAENQALAEYWLSR